LSWEMLLEARISNNGSHSIPNKSLKKLIKLI